MGSWFYKDSKRKLFEDDKCPYGYTDTHKAKSVVKKKVGKKKVVENKE